MPTSWDSFEREFQDILARRLLKRAAKLREIAESDASIAQRAEIERRNQAD